MQYSHEGLRFLILAVPVAAAILMIFRFVRRSAHEVLVDLETVGELEQGEGDLLRGYIFGDELASAGLISPRERRHFLLRLRLIPLLFVITALIAALAAFKPGVSDLFVLALGMSAGGYIASRLYLRRTTEEYRRSLHFYLPLVMERIVMAAEAGLDILPAVERAVEVEKPDPVSRLLQLASRLAQAGIGFEKGLNDVAERVDSRPLRHAFIHLALAQREGGELVVPLRELSDSTQLYYQEAVEEQIATMPARATFPLLLAFAGLILCFLTAPMIQVLGIMERSMP